MRAWISETFADEEGPMAVEGRSVIFRGSKEEMLAIARFMAAVAEHLDTAEFCHMHLSHHMPGWTKAEHVDIEMNVEAPS